MKSVFRRGDSGDAAHVAALESTLMITQALDEFRAWRNAFETQLRDSRLRQWVAEVFRQERSSFGRMLHGDLAGRFAAHRAFPDLAEAHAALLACAAATQALADSGRRDDAVRSLKEGQYAVLCRQVLRCLVSIQRPEEERPGSLRAA